MNYDLSKPSIERPFAKYKNIYTYTLKKRKHYFNRAILYYDFINLDLKNYFDPGVDIINLSEGDIIKINNFIEKYGVDFIERNEQEDLNYNISSISYFSRFTYIWGELKTLKILLEKDSKIPYSKSSKRYKKTGLKTNEFQKRILNKYLSRNKNMPTTKNKETLKNIYMHYDNPVAILFEYLLEINSKSLLKKCYYCEKYFVAKRKDSNGCSKHHNVLIRAKRRRLNKVTL